MDKETKDYIDKTKEEIFDNLGNRFQAVIFELQMELELIKKAIGLEITK